MQEYEKQRINRMSLLIVESHANVKRSGLFIKPLSGNVNI